MQVPEGIGALPFKGKWCGVRKHTGSSGYTPLKKSLAFKHVSGLYTITSGMLVWMSSRLSEKADTRVLDELALALFCYQQDESYYRSPDTRPSSAELDDADRFVGPIMYVLDEWYDHRSRSNAGWPVYPPHNMIGSLLELTRYVVGVEVKPIFDAWIQDVISMANEQVPFPGHSSIPQKYSAEERMTLAAVTMGRPLPPHVLDRKKAPDAHSFSAQWVEFLQSAEWSRNRFLRPPDDLALVKPGFRPYETSR
jgi:hypothetical protein